MDKQTESLEAFKKWWNEPEQAELRLSCAEGWGYRIWVASRDSLVVELPHEVTHVTNKYYEEGRDDVISAIEAIGIRIKGEGV